MKILLKLLLVVLLSAVLYYQLTQNEQLSLSQLGQEFALRWSWESAFWLFPALVFIGFNWGLETKKWQLLMRPVALIPFGQAFRSVLAGLTFSLFTPNRIGEYGGRVLLLQKGQRLSAVLATLIGSMAQWWVLWSSGLLAFAFFVLMNKANLDGKWLWVLFLVGISVSATLLWAYFNVNRLLYWMTGWRWTRRWATPLWDKVARHYTQQELLKVLLLSALRYSVYSFQYYFLLSFWGCDIPFASAMVAIGIIFLLQTGIPIPPATGLVVRGNISLWVFAYWGLAANQNLLLLAATWSLWLINIIVPALLGCLVLLSVRK